LEEQPRYEEAWRDQALREFSGQLAAAPQPCARGDEDIAGSCRLLCLAGVWKHPRHVLSVWTGGAHAGIPVRNGLFECDLERMECVPCYWEGGRQKLVRGTWYVLARSCPPTVQSPRVLSRPHGPLHLLLATATPIYIAAADRKH
jgi:hypothetical protein